MTYLHKNGGALIFISLTLLIALFVYDLMFSRPEHQQGLIVQKLFVPARTIVGETPYGGIKRGRYSISSEKQEQWIAFVKMENGDTLKVHCDEGHYKIKNVGDLIHFKRYQGKLFHIKYFAHNQEED